MKKLYWGLAVLAVSLVGGYLAYPHVVRWQVQKRISGVTFREVRVTWGVVTLNGVAFDRGWVRGTLNQVTSDWDQTHIVVTGGDIEADLDQKPPSTGEGFKRTIEASELTVRVKKGSYRATVEGARTKGSTEVCFERASLAEPTVTGENGCVARDGSWADLGKLTAEGREAMGVRIGSLMATSVHLDTRIKKATAKTVVTDVTLEGQTLPVEAVGVEATHGDIDRIHLDTLRTKHAWLAPDWTVIENLTVTHDKKWELSIGASQIHVDPESLTFEGQETCGTWVGSLPAGLRSSPLDKLELTGETSFKVSVRPKPSFTLRSNCRAICRTLPDLRKPFTYTAYTSKGEPFQRTAGRGTAGWLPVGLTGEMPLAVVNMEDPGFQHHHGFIPQAFANSLTDNLREGRFLRGGSTITMQLAKNLWLTREKTLGRKAQELFLAQALESCYQKDEILELYLNVVEFGPDKYGIGAGTQHWFKKRPAELSPTEAFWMASILPRPSRTGPPTEASLKRIEGLMKRLAADGRIPEFITEAPDTEMMEWEGNQ